MGNTVRIDVSLFLWSGGWIKDVTERKEVVEGGCLMVVVVEEREMHGLQSCTPKGKQQITKRSKRIF